MRGQVEPQDWERRYERDLEIQEDMEWLSEAVYQLYQVHLDRMIRKNDRLWGENSTTGMMPRRDMMS